MTRVLPLPAPARISTGPSVVSTASRCCGLSWSRKDKEEAAPELLQFYRGIIKTAEDAEDTEKMAQSENAMLTFSPRPLRPLRCSFLDGLALRAGADFTQVAPGIDAEVVVIVPGELDG